MTILQWLWSLRRSHPISAAEIRSELHGVKQQHAVTVQQRDLVALDAVNDDTAAMRWRHLGETAQTLAERVAVLAAALPQAEANEAAAAEAEEAARRERAMVAYQQHVQEAQQYTATVLGNLPDGATLTILRDWRDRLASEARDLRTWSNLPAVRRPPDPLSTVVDAMQHRLDRVVRARWAPRSPITLKGGATSSELSEATARVEDAS